MVSAPGVQTIEVELFGVGHARMDTARRRDPTTLNAVLAEEFTAAVADLCGSATTRAGWITNVLSRLAVDSFAYEALRVHAYGDVALVQARYRQEGAQCGQPGGERFTVTDLWIRRDDRWQVATRSVGRVAQACE
jgi:ketosteroid isomerase-like protein